MPHPPYWHRIRTNETTTYTTVAKLIISCEGLPTREVELGSERMTLGRHPHNDIVLDHPTVSSRHAAITLIGDEALLEDLGSTNGTWVHGKRVERHKLSDRGHAILAACHIDFVGGVTIPASPLTVPQGAAAPSTVPVTPVPMPGLAPSTPLPRAANPAASPAAGPSAAIEVTSGANAGRRLSLTKPLTTLGSPGVLVVVIARQGSGYTLTHVEGGARPLVNGIAVGRDPHPLANGDHIDLAGTTMSFFVGR